MFTGLIRELGEVRSFIGENLCIKAKHSAKIGDSIAINGACLTVVSLTNDGFCVQLSNESRKHLALENYKGKVHIEPAMMMGDRFEGHIVQGHIDNIATIIKITKDANSYDIVIEVDKNTIPYMVPKGSITIDGISLTINEIDGNKVRLTIIPHTMKETVFNRYKVGTRINVESDMFARYVAHIIAHQTKNQLSWGEVDNMVARY